MTLNQLFRPVENMEANSRIAIRPKRTFPAFVGLDPSLTKTGLVVHWGGADVRLHRIDSAPAQSGRDAKGKPAATWEDRRRRLTEIVRRVVDVTPDGSLVFIEAPAYGASGSGTFDRSGLWWWLYSELAALECVVVPVSPAQRAMYATGKGGGADAGKDAVIAAVTRRYPALDVRDNNVADAVVLAAMACRASGAPMEDAMPLANLKALDKLDLTGLDA